MNSKGKAWLLALLMGMVLPGLIISAGERFIPPKPTDPTEATIITTQPTEQTQPLQVEPAETITVLNSSGEIIPMHLDAYLIGVVLGEMPTDFHDEALKAQAVVARTYALKRHTTGQKHPAGAVCTDAACCQAWRSTASYLSNGGTQAALEKVTAAVQATSGQVLTYDGKLIDATYFSCSGGKTEDALAVWGTDIPYLQSVDSPGEENATHYSDTVKFTVKEFANLLGIGSLSGKWLGSVSYTAGDGVDTINIAGKAYKGTTIRQKLGLRSTAFSITVVGDSVHILTKGFGHRVGMSQYGAEAMAVGGSDYQTILAHYYPGTELKTNPTD